MPLDLAKLNHVRNGPNGNKIAQCPVCALEGHDLKNRNHLSIFPDGGYNCVVNSTHNKSIWKIAGIGQSEDYSFKIMEPKLEKIVSWPVSLISNLSPSYDYWLKRGVTEATQKQFDMGLAVKGQLSGRIVNGIFDREKRHIIGFAGRSIDNRDPRWKIIGAKKKFLYPLHLSHEHILKEQSIVFVEGIGCCLSLWEANIKNTLCLFGINVSSTILSYLIQYNIKNIYISLNNEKSGIGLNAALELKNTLLNFFSEERIKIALPTKKDFNEMSKLEIFAWKEAL
jgi:hypothetical protein